jgi:hypothetical protein
MDVGSRGKTGFNFYHFDVSGKNFKSEINGITLREK